jgi:hypothetical protein
MKNKKTVLGFALVLMAMIMACAKQYDAETDFKVEPVDEGKGVEITEYVGEKVEVRIPPRIQNLPVTSVGKNAFRKMDIVSVTIPNSVTSIDVGAFRGCSSLTDVTIPNSVTSIGDRAFNGCKSLTNITIPNKVTSIGLGAFGFCTSLASITIPDSVTTIRGSSFAVCTSLASVTFRGTIASGNLDRNVFTGDLRDKYLAGGKGTYTTVAPVRDKAVWTKK